MHTPGPWFADSSFVGARSIDRFIIKCSSKDLPDGVAEAEANARLIAAAPDLADALRWALDQIEDDLDPDHQAALAAARAALAAATGEA